MAALRDKLSMWQVTVYERQWHTNPVVSIFIRSADRISAVSDSLPFLRLHNVQAFQRVECEDAEWKQEEEICSPWQKVELP